MRKLVLALTLVTALAGARSASAATVNTAIHGNSCFAPANGSNLYYTQWGPYNTSTTTGVTVNCPVGLPSHNYTSVYLQVSAWSRNNSANKLSCTVNTTRYDGYDRSFGTATVPYNTAIAMTGTTSISPISGAGWIYLTCYIPPNIGTGYSYLSTIYIQGTY